MSPDTELRAMVRRLVGKRTGQTTTVAMGMFLQFLEAALIDIGKRFDAG